MDAAMLHELFEYRDGKLFWKIKISAKSRIVIGDEAGCIDGKGYRQIKINGKLYRSHRLIYLMSHGYLPKYIDHIDGNPLNNNLSNLREATLSQNSHNSKLSKSNKSGIKGVCWIKRANRWGATIKYRNSIHYVGQYKTLDAAEKAIKEARLAIHKEFANHG